MRLDKLHRVNPLLFEDNNASLTPLDPARYPNIKKHALAQHQMPEGVAEQVQRLKELVSEFPPGVDPPDYDSAVEALRDCQTAFKQLLLRSQTNAISGLLGESEYSSINENINSFNAKKEKFGVNQNGYIVIAADMDDTQYLNDKSGLGHLGVNGIFQNVGKLFKQFLGPIKNVKFYHPQGDEFRAVADVSNLSEEQVRVQFSRLILACLNIADHLASTGFYLEGWDDSRRIQPTISFGVSTSEAAADGILTHVKAGASSGKPMKYAVIIDRDVRHDLGLTPDSLGQYVQALQEKAATDAKVIAVDSNDVSAYDYHSPMGKSGMMENKTPMDEVRNRSGAVMLECSWSEVPSHRKQELAKLREQKRGYLKRPVGAMKVGDRYYPLNSALKDSSNI